MIDMRAILPARSYTTGRPICSACSDVIEDDEPARPDPDHPGRLVHAGPCEETPCRPPLP